MTARTSPGERGSVTLWLLGLCVMLLFLGGLSLDLWRAYSERRALAGAADAAAVAGAQALDTDHFRTTGDVALDPPVAEALALQAVAAQPGSRTLVAAHADATPEQVTVTLAGEVPLTLLAVLLPDRRPLPVRVTATARPGATPDPG